MSYHSLIFDLDGTLTDPLTGIVRCMNYALSSHDHQVKSEQEIRPYIGPPLEIALSDLSGELTRRGGSMVFSRCQLFVGETVVLTSSAVIKMLRKK